MEKEKLKSNKLLRKAFFMMYPSMFILVFMTQIEEFIDSILSGSFLGEESISAIAIGWPGIAVINAITVILGTGCSILMSINIGRGDKEKANQLYSIGMIGIPLVTCIIGILVILFPRVIVVPFSGGASEELIQLAEIYASAFGYQFPLYALEGVLSHVLAVYGHNKEVAIINVVGIPINIIASIAGIKLCGMIAPGYEIAGLVWGYFVSTLFQVVALFAVKCKNKIALKAGRIRAKFKEYIEIFKYGMPSGINFLIDAAICSVINLILVQNIGEEALSYYLVLESIALVGRVAAETGGEAGAPLFGLLFGAKDKNGMKESLKESIIVSMFFTFIWVLLLFLLLPIIIPNFGIEYASEGYAIVKRGILITLAFLPIYLVAKCLTNFYQSTGHFKYTLALSILPDSVIYPISLFFLIKIFENKYDAVWLTYGGCYLVFALLAYLIYVIKNKKIKWPVNDMLMLDKDFKENVVFDFSTTTETSEKNATISEEVIKFLKEQNYSDRISNMCGLCIEELNADFMEHIKNSKKDKAIEKEIMDIKLISDNGKLHMIIRNVARPYNPLDFEYDKEVFSKMGVVMVQKFAKKIEYSYVYRMNVITIDF